MFVSKRVSASNIYQIFYTHTVSRSITENGEKTNKKTKKIRRMGRRRVEVAIRESERSNLMYMSIPFRMNACLRSKNNII